MICPSGYFVTPDDPTSSLRAKQSKALPARGLLLAMAAGNMSKRRQFARRARRRCRSAPAHRSLTQKANATLSAANISPSPVGSSPEAVAPLTTAIANKMHCFIRCFMLMGPWIRPGRVVNIGSRVTSAFEKASSEHSPRAGHWAAETGLGMRQLMR